MRLSAIGLLLLLASISFAPCESGSDDRATPGDWLPRGAAHDTGVAVQAALRAVLTRDGDCLYGGVESERILLAFPREPSLARWDEQSSTLTLRGRAFAVGAPLDVGGGEVEPGAGFWSRPPDASCDAELVWVVGGVP